MLDYNKYLEIIDRWSISEGKTLGEVREILKKPDFKSGFNMLHNKYFYYMSVFCHLIFLMLHYLLRNRYLYFD